MNVSIEDLLSRDRGTCPIFGNPKKENEEIEDEFRKVETFKLASPNELRLETLNLSKRLSVMTSSTLDAIAYEEAPLRLKFPMNPNEFN